MSHMTESNGNTSRYAIYFSPRSDALLFSMGSEWLGRNAENGAALHPRLPDHIQYEDWQRATESPRRYGFHATLKPPFRLAEGARYEDLQAALHDFARGHNNFETPRLHVAPLGRFLALTLSEPSEELHSLAADCVGAFDPFRAPASEKELGDRLRDSLSPREREHVLRWSYPYVFDTWKFHMTLTSSLAQEPLAFFSQFLRAHFLPVCELPMVVDSICLFHESRPGGPFQLVDRASLRSL
jgi:putative phosphonate metabolism protein